MALPTRVASSLEFPVDSQHAVRANIFWLPSGSRLSVFAPQLLCIEHIIYMIPSPHNFISAPQPAPTSVPQSAANA